MAGVPSRPIELEELGVPVEGQGIPTNDLHGFIEPHLEGIT